VAKDKLFSTSIKPRSKQPNQVLRTANVGRSALQTQYDQDPYTTNSNTIKKTPHLPKTAMAPASPVHQRPKSVSVNTPKRKTTKPSAYTGVFGAFKRSKQAFEC
jgi:hypothetical protein